MHISKKDPNADHPEPDRHPERDRHSEPDRLPESEKGPRGVASEEDFHEEDVLDRPFDRGLAKRLTRYLRPYLRYLALSLGLILLSTGAQLLGPILMKEAIDGPFAVGAVEEPSWLFATLVEWAGGEPGSLITRDVRLKVLWGIVGIYFALLLVAFVARYFQSMAMNVTGQSVMRDLRMELFAKLQRQSLTFYNQQPVGRLVTRVTNDIEALNELFTSGLVMFIGDILTVIGIVILLFAYNPALAGLALMVAPGLVLVTMIFRSKARLHYREIRRSLAHLNAYTQESITGLEVIQVSRREGARAAGYERISRRYLGAFLGSIFWYAIFFPSVEIFSTVSLALVLTYGADNIIAGSMNYGEFFLFWICLNRFFIPLRDLADKYNILQSAMAAGERFFGVLDAESILPEAETPQAKAPLTEKVRFEDVSFAYDGKNPVLRGVSFDVKRGETVAIVGATGAGKSTIVNLLLRFHDPTNGRVLIDGVDAREFALPEHRERFGLVLQDVAVFSRDVESNLDLDRGLDSTRLRAAAEQVHAHPFIERLEGGYGEAMLERGRNLSSGERQLLAFARALAGNPEILVLDEATSHIDSETESLIQDALGRLTEGRTSVVIAHRLSTIRSADRILVLHNGELREEGSHHELLALDGIYARLHRLQFTGTAASDPGAS